MKYLVQTQRAGDTLPPDNWTEIEADNMQAAALAHLRAGDTKAVDFPLTVFVSDGRLRHKNGSPMDCHGFKFELTRPAVKAGCGAVVSSMIIA